MRSLINWVFGSALVVTQVQSFCQVIPSGQPVLPSKPGITVLPARAGKGDTILWSGPRRLTWADYEGAVPEKVPYSCATTIMLMAAPEKSDKGLVWFIHPVFSRSRSWVQGSSRKNTEILVHERLHFDMAEVYARKIRQYVANYTGAYSDEAGRMMSSRIDALRAEMESENVRYDLESKHGTDPVQQARWTRDITKWLNDLEGYRWRSGKLKER